LTESPISGPTDGAPSRAGDPGPTKEVHMNRKLFWGVLVIGVALVITPFAISLPGKSAAGERMMSDFQPLMQPAQVKTTAYYYNQVFTPLGKVVPAMGKDNVDTFYGYVTGLESINLTPAQMGQLQAQFPDLARVLASMPVMLRDFDQLVALMQANEQIFAQVPAGLDHYGPLVTAMQGNVNDFRQINSLPDFRLFTWFFVVPGILLTLLAAFGLWGAALEVRIHHGARPTHA
jgi:hypothetical protein